MRRFAVLITLVACGRLHFDATNDATRGGGGGDSGVPGDGIVVTDAPMGVLGCVATGPEICDGIDNDCNGVIDDGCSCTTFDQTLSIPKLGATNSGFLLAFTGADYRLLLARSAALTVLTVDQAGTASAETTLISAYVDAYYPSSIAWNGSVLAIVYTNASQATIALYDPATNALRGSPLTLSSAVTAQEIRVHWLGDRFAVMWTDHTTFARRDVSETGALLSPETTVTTIANQMLQSFLITPAGTLLCVQPPQSANSALYLVDGAGTAMQTAVTFGLGFGCEIRPGPGAYVVALTQAISADGAFTLVDASGGVLATGKLATLVQPSEYLGIQPLALGTGYWFAATYTPDQTMTNDRVETFETDAAGTVVAGPTPFGAFTTGSFKQPYAIATDGRHAYATVYDLAPSGTNPSHVFIGQHCP